MAVVVMLAAYPLSFGPACWISSRAGFGPTRIPVVYRPITLAMSSSNSISGLLQWYAKVGAVNDWHWESIRPEGKAKIWIWTLLYSEY